MIGYREVWRQLLYCPLRSSSKVGTGLPIVNKVLQIQRRHCRQIFSYANPCVATNYRSAAAIGNCFTREYGRYEPDYLDVSGPQISKYELINFQLTGYDFTTLEEFQKFVHNSAERFGFDVEDAWGTPSKHLKVTRLKPESTVVEAEYKLQVYERNVQISHPESTTLPLFIDIIQSSLPAGVTLRIQPHFREYTEIRYVPDFALKEVKTQLEDLLSDKKRKK